MFMSFFAKNINSINDVSEWQLCCGCGVCAYLYPDSIEMIDMPVVGRRPRCSALDDGQLQQALDVCPGIRVTHNSDVFSGKGGRQVLAKSWGPICEVWEGYASDSEIRFKGSSGGVITALSLYCLEQEELHGVLHITANSEKPYLNATTLSTDKDFLLSGTGSRYSPASPCEKLGEVEGADRASVVVGKPCDIAAVHNACKIRPHLDSNVLLTIACFCAGTPSTNGTLEMLHQMGVNNPDDISGLRYRGHGWPGLTVADSLTSNDENGYKKFKYEESWGNILQKYRQWRCYICPDHTGEFADLAIGDPWYKKKEKGDEGQSLIVVRTARGKKILEKAIAAGYLVAARRADEVLLASQPNLKNTRARLWGQLLALKLCCVPCPDYKGFSLFANWLTELTFSGKLKSVLGTVKRVFVKKLYKRNYYS